MMTIGDVKDLCEVSTNIVCGPFGSTLITSDIDPDGDVVLVQPTDISGLLFNSHPEWRITEAKRCQKNLALYEPETMVFARVGIYPHCGVLPATLGKATISSRIIAARIDQGQSDPYFVMSFFRSRIGRIILYSIQKVTAQPVIGTDELSSAVVPCPTPCLQHSIGHKVRAAELLRAHSQSRINDAVDQLNHFFSDSDLKSLNPNSDGRCDYFASSIRFGELSHFHGAQFYAPKRNRAVELVRGTGVAKRIGDCGKRTRSKAKRTSTRGHLDPANVDTADGYWSVKQDINGGDVALAKPADVLFLRMRPYLNKTTINDSHNTVSASPEFLIYGFEAKDAFYAALCLRQPWSLAQVAEIATGDRPRVDGDFVDDLVVPWPEASERQNIGNIYESSFLLRRRADSLVQQAIADVESLIEGTLNEAECIDQGRQLAEEFELEMPQ
jgi:hypothetical protein